MEQLIEQYLEYHKLAWSSTTLSSERYRLMKVARLRLPDARSIYEALVSSGMKPYTVKTTIIRLVALEKWVKAQGLEWGYDFQKFYSVHKNRFKHAYVKQDLNITFAEARKRVATLESPYREAALGLLETGLRISEMAKAKDGFVVGKGGKRRRIYGTIDSKVSTQTLRLKLKAVGLKPHTLRKLCATRLAEHGATAADLCEVFGWTSIETSYRYLQHRGVDKLRELVKESTKAGEGEDVSV